MRKKPADEEELDDLDEFEDEELAEEENAAPEPPPPPKIPEVTVLFQDEHLLVIGKPAGVDSTRGQYAQVSVLDVLEEKIKDLPGPLRLVHRLDRETSGLMLLAKTPEAQRDLSAQWETRTVEKTYLAIVHGVVGPAEGTIDLPLKKTHSNPVPWSWITSSANRR